MPVYTLRVNQQQHTVDVPEDMPLLWVLRDVIGLTGTKYSCGIGLCGTCTVHVSGEPLRACTVPIANVSQQEITTIEGLAAKKLHPVQQAWLDEQVAQCGYCQPGQVMSAVALLKKIPNPTDTQIDQYMASNLCRCGTYLRIRRAIHRAAKLLNNANTS